MSIFRQWISGRRGAATTEKLLVLMFAIVLIGGAMLVFGPTLNAKYEQAAGMLGHETGPKTPTLADAPVARDTGPNPVWYVVFTIAATLFFLAFVSPLLFPRARRTRQKLFVDLAERFPVLTPLIDPDARAEAGMGELRDLAREVNELDRHKDGALQIDAQDFGRMALPSEETVDAEFFERPDLEIPTSGPHQGASEEAVTVEDVGTDDLPTKERSREDEGGNVLQLGVADDDQATQTVEPLSQRLARVEGDDGIPFDAVDPSVKPQMAPLDTPPKPGFEPIGDASESATINIEEDTNEQGDELVGRILHESGRMPFVGDDDATIIRDSGATPAVAPDATTNPEAPTEMHDDFNREEMRKSLNLPGLEKTVHSNVRAADDPDATTQDYQSYSED